jgi:glucose-6-phosphate dehydrogenase assembly protein OpcA
VAGPLAPPNDEHAYAGPPGAGPGGAGLAEGPSPLADGEPSPLATWHGEAVSLGEVLEALDELRGVHRRTASRTSVLNLTVVADDVAGATRAATTARSLNSAHPGRTVVISCSPSRPPRIEADVALFESVKDDEQVWWEEIRLRLGGPVCGQVSSLVEPLALPDLPRVAWFVDDVPLPADELVGRSQVVVVDSDSAAAAGRSSPDALFARSLDLAARPGLVDLAWIRTGPWREVCARLFDSAHLARFLRGVESVRTEGPPVPSGLLAGWLADRLELDHSQLSRAGGGPPRLEIAASDGGARGIFTVSPRSRQLEALALVEGDRRARATVALPADPVAWSVSEALGRLHTDELYLSAAVRCLRAGLPGAPRA